MSNKPKNNVMPENWYDALPRAQYASLLKVESADPWFSVYQIRNNIFAIYEDKHFQEVISYLVIGSNKALLIDTGLGIGDIHKVVTSLYDGEITVAHTHTHFDHIGGDYSFKESYVLNNEIAFKRLRRGLDYEEVKSNVEDGCNSEPYPDGFDKENYCIKPANKIFTFEEGFTFDLGNMKLEVLETPGHSPDSVMFADHENKILFTGDTFYPATLYAHINHNDGSNSDFQRYHNTIKKIASAYCDYTLLTSHNEPLRCGIELIKVLKAFDEIASGSDKYILDENNLKKYQFEDFAIITS
ncbi:MAG: MBL fold metallo-hydrolase [Erysipelotrichaceae bacterium]|nr:MBL fold metallo-hydrolase [Erysipelotrichaceae bacterium]